MAALNSGTRDGHTGDGAHGSGGSRRRDAGEASQGGEVEGVASRAEAKERERAHCGHGSTTGGHGGSALVRPERERESEKEQGTSAARLRRSRACGSAWHWGRTRVGKLRPRGNGGSVP